MPPANGIISSNLNGQQQIYDTPNKIDVGSPDNRTLKGLGGQIDGMGSNRKGTRLYEKQGASPNYCDEESMFEGQQHTRGTSRGIHSYQAQNSMPLSHKKTGSPNRKRTLAIKLQPPKPFLKDLGEPQV